MSAPRTAGIALAGLAIEVLPSALMGAVGLWLILGIAARLLTPLTWVEAILGSGLVMLLHYVSEFLHQVGHAWAARRTGYPMVGVRFWWVLSTSLYPADEPTLPGKTHIRRALGGPSLSALVMLVGTLLTLLLVSLNAPLVLVLVALVSTLDNLLVFTLGAFIPLSWTDGGTLLRWWGQ